MATVYRDRPHAGMELAAELARLGLERPVVLALPRGGVPVAAEIARVLGAPLDVVLVRKVGAPGHRELAIAAIVDGDPPEIVVNREIVADLGVGDVGLNALVDRERPELERQRRLYLGRHAPLSIEGMTAIIVDDGIATGATVKAAIRALKRRSPREIVLAVPVAPPDVMAELGREAVRIVCLSQPQHFRAVGCHYLDFSQVSDETVIEALDEASARRKITPAGDS